MAPHVSRDADLVLVGGRIFTSNPERSWARAMAVRGDRLLAVGTDAQAERWSGPRTRRVDLRGRVVVPGFIDAHAHMADSAGEIGWTDLSGAPTLEATLDRLRRATARVPSEGWVVGVDWDEAKWPERRYPLREDLDRVSTAVPVVARRVDCHMIAVNSKALERATDLVSVRGYEVDRSGRPTGILKEDAFEALHGMFGPSEKRVEAGLAAVARRAHRLGITSVHDIVDDGELRAYQRARRRGRLRLRVYAMPRDGLLPHLVATGLMTGLGDAWLRLGAVKVFSDGSLGACTAALSEPYAGRPSEKGMLVHPPAELRSILEAADRAGFQTATHAIGDEAIREVLTALEGLLEEGPRRDHRHRIEHFELPDEDLLRRTKESRLIASCQPNFVGQWSAPGGMYEDRMGRERASMNNPYRAILRRGIPLCFGSDGMPYGPLYGIHAAVNGFFEDQRISPEEAVRAYTSGGAYASFEEDAKGTLEPGRLADFVVLDDDVFTEPARIRRARIRSTWVGGVRVYAR